MASSPDQDLLTLSFLDREPRSAARVLGSIGASDVAAFLNRAPARIVGKAVSAMIPWSAARCVERMEPEKASALLRSMSYSDAVSILRLVKTEKREELLACSTKRFARSFRSSLTYPKDCVGAWMDVEVPSFQEAQRVGDVMRSLKRLPSAHSHAFVTNDAKQYCGVVPVAELLRQDESTMLGDLVDTSLKPLSNRASLLSCEARTDWDHMNLLPVIGRKQNFLGALSRASLRKALSADNDEDREILPGSIMMQLLSAILVVGSAFAELMKPYSPDAEPANRKRKSGGR